ncbi:MAG: DegT/DnrJ/EryC1/StrS family aminotransferase [Acidobacteria bacterium]|nr:DegT/DnrJ/EryC1/StrS family aminotransferase [Acidobacteriota bacterium]
MIRLTIPTIEKDDLEAVRLAVASGFLVQGPRVAAFEKAVAECVGVKHAVAVGNCTCALQLALLVLGVGPGDICLVTAYSWVATANVIELCGARPVFVDVNPDTYNLDLGRLEEMLCQLMSDDATAGRIKAVLPVHAFGQMADMHGINALCARWNLSVIEDAACALGATLHTRQAGTWSILGCFSFHPRKAITTGEGGMITTNDDTLARRLRALRNHGMDPEAGTPDFILPGYNYRMTEFQAALGSTQLSKLKRIVDARIRAAGRYNELLEGSPLRRPQILPGATHVYQSYVALLPAEATTRRSEIIRLARERGVELQIGTVHIPMTTYYRKHYGYQPGDFPATDAVAARALTLPLYETISGDEQRTVVEVLTNLLE